MNRIHWIVLLALLLTSCSETPADYYQGYLELDSVDVAAPQAGQVQALLARRGEAIQAGQRLLQLDDTRELAAQAEAAARVAAAEARWQDLQQGRRPPERQVIQAQLAQARTQASQSEAESRRRQELIAQGLLPREQADAAMARARADQQRVSELRAQLAVADLPGRSDQIDALAAEVESARAALAQADWQLSQRQLLSPVDGWVREHWFEVGEWLPAGQPALSLLPAGRFEVRFFVPVDVAGRLQPGERVQLSGMALPTPLAATINHIAAEPEFAPPLIFSRDRNERLLFQIRARIDTAAEQRLSPGLPVEVRLP
ncbi:MAG: HlyD family efflux transporter periplasmic adaptor subunit [Xanthomonadales bacterium]|nr:HlyD family efflux transporter periplasmic adaptor subunit [Xanthomonadales bacterium]